MGRRRAGELWQLGTIGVMPAQKASGFGLATLAASFCCVAFEAANLSDTSDANTPPVLGRHTAAVPSAQASKWPSRAKGAGADLSGRCAAAPSSIHVASALIANIAHFQYRRSPALSLHALFLRCASRVSASPSLKIPSPWLLSRHGCPGPAESLPLHIYEPVQPILPLCRARAGLAARFFSASSRRAHHRRGALSAPTTTVHELLAGPLWR